jgi:hypothetical protein
MTKTRLFTISTLCVILFGVIGYGVYNYIRQYRENPYTFLETDLIAPYTWHQQKIIDGGVFTLSPREEIFNLDVDSFQPKREIEDEKEFDTEDLTIVEMRIKNMEFLTLRVGFYSPTRDKIVDGPSLGTMLNFFHTNEKEITIFFINENRVNLESFSKLNPSAYVVALPKTNILPNDYTQYFIVPTGVANQDTIEVETSIYNLTDKLSSLEEVNINNIQSNLEIY